MTIPNRELNRQWLKPFIGTLLVTVCLPIVATAVISGKSSVEKMLTSMFQPLFMAIVTSLVVGIVLKNRAERRIGWLMISSAILMWILGSHVFVSNLIMKWESSIETLVPTTAEPIEYVIVLGGGTEITPDGRAQFGQSGDRVGYAARLYLSGKVKNLVTTGDTLQLSGSLSGKFELRDDPSQQTKQIWLELGIPSHAISELPGQNTSAEMAALKKHPEYWRDKRCGILTSALHLPRAIKLAEKVGIHALPIAADYRSSIGPLTLNKFIPEAAELEKLQALIKEWAAIQISR